MRVHKITTVPVGNGSPEAIIEALTNCEVPAKAVATKVEIDFSTLDAGLNSPISIVSFANIVFEWDDEE